MEQQNKKEIKILKDIKFVGVTFDPDSFKKGEDELNKAIEMGYKVITDYPTPTGVVFSVGSVRCKGGNNMTYTTASVFHQDKMIEIQRVMEKITY